MPIYVYQCDECGYTEELFQHMGEEPLQACSECGSSTCHRVPTRVHTDLAEFRKPIEMMSIGLSDDAEIMEFKRRCPDVEVSMNPGDDLYGVPIARNRHQKLAALAAVGFAEIK